MHPFSPFDGVLSVVSEQLIRDLMNIRSAFSKCSMRSHQYSSSQEANPYLAAYSHSVSQGNRHDWPSHRSHWQ